MQANVAVERRWISLHLRSRQPCDYHEWRLWWYMMIHDHQMETFFALLTLCVGIHQSPGYSLHKGQWRGALMFSLICAWASRLINDRDAGDLRRPRARYDVTVMIHTDKLTDACSFTSSPCWNLTVELLKTGIWLLKQFSYLLRNVFLGMYVTGKGTISPQW